MDIGMVGLGRMGGNMTLRLLRAGHRVVAFDRVTELARNAAAEGAEPAGSLDEMVEKLAPPRAVWLMVPAGSPVEATIDELSPLLAGGDVLIDGGNSNYKDSIRRAAALTAHGIRFVDAGTSGGIWGLTEGYCLMVGGEQEAFAVIEPALRSLAPDGGYLHTGPSGSGHFTKMIHNGIEYGMMQAFGEGFELLKNSRFDIDLGAVAELWRHGSVVRSWLLDLTAKALTDDPGLESIDDHIGDSGEGRWTVIEAVEQGTPASTLALSLFNRFASQRDSSFANKVQAALRREFGGHTVRSAES